MSHGMSFFQIQPKINSPYKLSSTTSSFGVEAVSSCSPNLHYDYDSSSSIVVVRRSTIPTSISGNRRRRLFNRKSQLQITTTAQPMNSSITITCLNWLPNGPELRDLELREHRFSLVKTVLQFRKRQSLCGCSRLLQSQTPSEGMR